MWFKRLTGIFLLTLLIGQSGCIRQMDQQEAIFGRIESDHVCAVMIDMSGSFSHRMANDGDAYRFCMAIVDRYFRSSLGSNNRIIIAQISGTDRPLLFEGTPLELRQRFPTPEKFRDFLLANADYNGSRVDFGVSNTAQYLADHPAVQNGAKPALFVLSDMQDTDEGSQANNLHGALQSLAQRKGIVGLYYVDQNLIQSWQSRLSNAGFSSVRVESEIVGRPNLPAFDF